MPKPRHLSDHYGIPPEEYWKGSSFVHDPNYFGRQIATARDLLRGKEDGPIRALDIGVGIGKAVISMQSAGMDVWGIEPSEPFHRHALERTGLSPERLKCVSIEEAEFPEASFDFITFGAVLEHLYDPAAAIGRSMKWLRPGGVWHAEVPSSDHLIQKITNLYFRLRGTNYVTSLSPMHAPFHIHEFTLDSFKKLMARSSGIEMAKHHYDVASIYNVPRFLHPLLRRVMAKTDTGMQLTVWLRRV
jgi:SAM-dependent methyltransferase